MQDNESQDNKNSDLVTPYSNMENLRMVRSAVLDDPDLVDWRVARFFAVLEKIDFESMYPWHGAKVSQYPVVIYHADSNKPRYYEFRVIRDGVELGSIACNASKSEGTPIAYVSEITNKVTAKTAEKLVNPFGEAKLAAVNYPNKLVMRETNVSTRSVSEGETDFKDALTGQVIDENAIFIEKRVDDILADADDEMLKKLDITADAKTEMLAEVEEFDVDMADLWASIDEITPKILATSDEEIEREYQNPEAIMPMERKVYKIDNPVTVQQKMLADWVAEEHWGNPPCYCAPAAVSFVVIGLGNKSGYSKYPVGGWSSQLDINNVYYDFENKMGKGPRLFMHIAKAMRDDTNYKVDTKLFHKWTDVNAHLNSYDLPVISLRLFAPFTYGWPCHYRVIIGTRTDRIREYHKYSWWWFGWKTKYWTKDKYKYWYYMHDNGSDGCRFWEKSGRIYQFQLGLVKHK